VRRSFARLIPCLCDWKYYGWLGRGGSEAKKQNLLGNLWERYCDWETSTMVPDTFGHWKYMAYQGLRI
jgi:hypothetical protein